MKQTFYVVNGFKVEKSEIDLDENFLYHGNYVRQYNLISDSEDTLVVDENYGNGSVRLNFHHNPKAAQKEAKMNMVKRVEDSFNRCRNEVLGTIEESGIEIDLRGLELDCNICRNRVSRKIKNAFDDKSRILFKEKGNEDQA
jgi:hypothetical protein